MSTARATTGVLGNRLYGELDLNNLTPMYAGDTLHYRDREVSFDFNGVLSDVIVEPSRKAAKYNLLATILMNTTNIKLSTPVSFYVSGIVKEIRVKKTRYRIAGNKYLGKVEARTSALIDDDEY